MRTLLTVLLVRLQQQGAKNVFAHVELRTLRAAERIMRRHRRHPLSVLLGERLTVMLEYAAPLVKDAEPSYTLFTPFVRGDEMDVRTLFGSHAKNIRQIRFRTFCRSESNHCFADVVLPRQMHDRWSIRQVARRSLSS